MYNIDSGLLPFIGPLTRSIKILLVKQGIWHVPKTVLSDTP